MHDQRIRLIFGWESAFFVVVTLLLVVDPVRAEQPHSKPNVLFLCVDDMKDWVNCLGGYEGTVYTPNIDRLAKRGMLFTNAHCASPKCAPSRAAIMTGLRPSTTGLYDNGHWWMPNLPEVVTIPAHFRTHGYRVVGAGKIFHHTAGNHPPNQWDEFRRLKFREDPSVIHVCHVFGWLGYLPGCAVSQKHGRRRLLQTSFTDVVYFRPPPCLPRCLRRALSTRMRRIASAAAAKKWRRLFQC